MKNKWFYTTLLLILFICGKPECYAIDRALATQKFKELITDNFQNATQGEIKYLLKYDADINVQDEQGNTLLIAAARKGDLDLVELLVELGADINKLTKTGNTAFMIASLGGQKKIVDYLYKTGAMNSRVHKARMQELSKFVTFNKVLALDKKNNQIIFEFKGPLAQYKFVLPEGGVAHIKYPLSGLIFSHKDLKPPITAKIYWNDSKDITQFSTKAVEKQFEKTNSRDSMMDLHAYKIIGLQSYTPTKEEVLKENKRMLTFNPPKSFGPKKTTRRKKPKVYAKDKPESTRQSPAINGTNETLKKQKPSQKSETPVKTEKTDAPARAKSEVDQTIKHPDSGIQGTGKIDQAAENHSEQFTIITIMETPGIVDHLTALVEDAKTGKGYMVVEGAKLGPTSAKVKSITRHGVVIEEKYKDERGVLKTNVKNLSFKTSKARPEKSIIDRKKQEPPRPENLQQKENLQTSEMPQSKEAPKAPDTPKKPEATEKHSTPLEQISIDELKIIGIMDTPGKPDHITALVENIFNGMTYELKLGSRIGKNSGRVKAINKDEVIIEEIQKDESGITKSSLKTLTFAPHQPAAADNSPPGDQKAAKDLEPPEASTAEEMPQPVQAEPENQLPPVPKEEPEKQISPTAPQEEPEKQISPATPQAAPDNQATIKGSEPASSQEENTKPEALDKPKPKTLDQIRVEHIKIIAIVETPGKLDHMTALVEDTTTGKNYAVIEGTLIGLNSGKVKTITKNKVIIEQLQGKIITLKLKNPSF